MSSPFEPLIITEKESLARLCDRLAEAGSFAFDTEFVGEDSYHPEVCLIQVATHEFHALIDPIVGQLDLGCFWDLLIDPKIEILVHAGSEDLSICYKQTGKCPTNLVDLQIAAGFCGMGHPISLGRLVSNTLHQKVHKSQTLTDWRRRPFTDEQLTYAIEDVVYLPDAYKVIRGKVEELGRWDWVMEECEALCASVASSTTDPEKPLRRMRGTASMSGRQLALLAAILKQREELAVKNNRPARAVMKDHLAIELARRGWSDIEKMRSLRGLTISNTDLRSIGLAIESAKKLPPEAWPEMKVDDTPPEEDVLLAFITAVLRAHCDQIELAYSLLSTRADIKKLIRATDMTDASADGSSLRRGWRAVAVGDLLTRVLSGDAAVRVIAKGGARKLVVEPGN